MELLNFSIIRLAIPVQPKLRRAKRAPSTDNSFRNLGYNRGIDIIAPNSMGRCGSANNAWLISVGDAISTSGLLIAMSESCSGCVFWH